MNMNDAFIGSLIFNKNGGGGASTLEDLSDINITAPQNGQALVYDEENEKWVNGQGGGKQTALTQAEYDALVEAGTVDPTMEYFITDGIPASVKYYHNYSTVEQVVGTWIDGSTLYEKTYTITAPDNGTTANLVDLSDLNIDTVIDILGYLKSTNNITYKDDGFKAWIRLKANPLIDNKDYIAMQVTNADYYSQSGSLTIRYTKSSS